MTTTPIDRRNFLLFIGAVGASASISSSAFANLARPNQAPSFIYTWDELRPGFHALIDPSTGGNALAVISKSKSKAILIDTKFAHLGGALLQDTQAFANNPDKLDLTLINTHHHGDHTGGNALIVPHTTHAYAHTNAVDRIKAQLDKFKQSAKAGPAQVRRSKGSKEQLALAIKAANGSEGWTQAHIAPTNPVPNEGAELTLADTKVALHHFGAGHTDNDLVVHFQDHNLIHTGDLVFAGLHPFFDPSAGVTAKGWITSLKGILDLCDSKTTIIPGHGPLGTKHTVQSQLDYLEQLITHVQADIDAGTPKSESVQQEWPFMKGLGFESIRGRAIGAVYEELV